MVQVVDFITWTRTVNGDLKTSILDHIYSANPLSILNLTHTWPFYTDHALITFEIDERKKENDVTIRRDWRNYTKEKLNQMLDIKDWNFKSDNVQAYWDEFENQLINIQNYVCFKYLLSSY